MEHFDIDVRAQAADALTSVSNKLVIPDPTGAFGSTCEGDVEVYMLDPTKNQLTPLIGVARLMSLSSDKTFFAFEVDYLTISDGPIVTLADLFEANGPFSTRLLVGPPSATAPIDGLRVPLKMTEKSVNAGDVLDVTGATHPFRSRSIRWPTISVERGARLGLPTAHSRVA